MPGVEVSDLKQRAVLWAKAGQDAYNQPLVGEPEEIPVRWLDKRTEALGKDGNPVALDATAFVDRRIEIGSEMWLGTLDDWYGAGSAGQDSEVFEVKLSGTVPDVKGRQVRRSVGLIRKGDRVGV